MATDPLISDLLNEDVLGAVVRAHIHLEQRLRDIIHITVPYPQHIDKMNLEYSQLVELVLALGLKEQYRSPLHALGKIRNKFAHDLSAKLDKNSVDNLYNCLHKEDKGIVQEAFKKLQVTEQGLKRATFASVGAKGRFILIIVAIRAALEAAIEGFKDTTYA